MHKIISKPQQGDGPQRSNGLAVTESIPRVLEGSPYGLEVSLWISSTELLLLQKCYADYFQTLPGVRITWVFLNFAFKFVKQE